MMGGNVPSAERLARGLGLLECLCGTTNSVGRAARGSARPVRGAARLPADLPPAPAPGRTHPAGCICPCFITAFVGTSVDLISKMAMFYRPTSIISQCKALLQRSGVGGGC